MATSSAHVFINGSKRPVTVEFTSTPDVLLVKSTFLEFGDGLTLRNRFARLRKAVTEPTFDKDSDVRVYEPGTEPIHWDLPEDGSSRDARPQAWARPKTTVMLRNSPNNYTRTMLIRLLDGNGFTGDFDFLYLPVDFDRKANLGYAFVNLVNQEVANRLWATFDNFTSWSIPSTKVCQVSWSPKQGFKVHVDRYKNSPVMHKSVPDEYKPVIFANGVKKRFPAPTIRIQHPKHAGKQ